jgi:diguanylate cyclase (GGDEF)-like protein/putative nucleotidyltransferase with HDIG domain
VSPTAAQGSGGETGSTGSLVLAVGGFLALAVAYLEVARSRPVGSFELIVGDLGFVGLILAVAVLAAAATLRSKRGPERRLWGHVTILYAVLLASELYWVWIVTATGAPPAPVYAPFQVLHTVAALLYLAVVASLTPLVAARPLMRARQLLDIVSFAVVVYVMAFFLSVAPLFSGVAGSTPGDALVGAVYPTWAVLMIAGLAWPMLSSERGHRHRSWARLLVIGLALYAVAIAAWPLWFAWVMDLSATGEQAVLDVLLMLSHYLVMLALLRRRRESGQRWTPPRPAATPTVSARAVAYLMLAFIMVAMPFMIALAIVSPEGSLTREVLTIASALLASLTVVRTVLTAIESGRLFHSSKTDPLTGLYNHRHFREQLLAALEMASRFDGTLAVVAFDLDGFDMVNDRHGHPAGDELLRQVGAALTAACGDSGVMCRVGGDEFAAVLPGADAAAALRVAAQVRRRLGAIRTPDDAPITVSTGISLYPAHADDAESLISLADGAAYWVKRHGKDHALIYDPAVVTELSPDDLVLAAEREAESSVVRALAAAVDARHEYTSTHSVAVARWAMDVARRLGLDEQRIRLVETAALLHDVGMVAVGEDAFDKPESLSELDLDVIRMHPHLGARIVAGTLPEPVQTIIRHHHEHWDGTGYPDGLRAVAIPLGSRVLHVCGAYDAMTSARPYRPAMSVAQAVERLREGAGTQFDPEVVDVFLEGLGALGGLRTDQ